MSLFVLSINVPFQSCQDGRSDADFFAAGADPGKTASIGPCMTAI